VLRNRSAKGVRQQLVREVRQALTHGRIAAMWLAPGFVVRMQSWLGDCMGGGSPATVVAVESDPPMSVIDAKLGRMHGFVSITLRDVHRGYDVYTLTCRAYDLVELVRPEIATPTQWRSRRS